MRYIKARALLMALVLGGASGAVQASLITHLDSYGVEWTLSTDGTNYGDLSNPVYKVTVTADTTGFTASKGGADYDFTDAYINTVTILAGLDPTGGSVSGPGGAWTNMLGGQNSNGCDGSGAHFDCAYFNAGGNDPITGPGVLMNLNGGSLEWDFLLSFAADTAIDDALSFDSDGSHLKVDYYGYQSERVCTGQGQDRVCSDQPVYDFIGQISDDVTVNLDTPCTVDCLPPPCTDCSTVPEPESVALLGLGLIGMGAMRLMRRRLE